MLNAELAKHTIILFLFLFSALYADDSKQYLALIERDVRKEYQKCTNDQMTNDLDSILRWKQKITLRTESPDYFNIRRQYYLYNRFRKNIYPCEILQWYNNRMAKINTREENLRNKIVSQDENYVERIRNQRELSTVRRSSFDFYGIPFGLSKRVFHRLYQESFGSPLVELDNNILVAEHFNISSFPFMVEFYFNNEDIFFKYAIKGYKKDGSKLATFIREQGTALKNFFKDRLKTKGEDYFVGDLDIGLDKVKAISRWKKGPYL